MKRILVALSLLLFSVAAHAQTEPFGTYIGGLPAAGSSSGGDKLYILQGGVSKSISPSLIGGVPGGSNLNVQFNNGGVFGGLTDVQLTTRIQLFSNTLSGAVPGSGGGSTNFLRADGTWNPPPTSPPGSPSLSVQFNNAGSFAGMSGTSWDDTNRSLTMTGATITAIHPVIDMSQTWNNASIVFEGLRLNITDTASNQGSTTVQGSNYLDLQRNGVSTFAVYKGSNSDPTIWFSRPGDTSNVSVTGGAGALTITRTDSGTIGWIVSSSANFNGFFVNSSASNAAFGWASAFSSADLYLTRDAAAILAQRNAANAQTFRVYNTSDANGTAPTNYERGVIDWTTTSNVLTIGVQKGGTGTLRDVFLTSGGTSGVTVTGSNGRVNIYGGAGSGGNVDVSFNAGGMSFGLSAYILSWNSTGTATVGTDTGITRNAAGVIEINNGTAGTLRDLKLRTLTGSGATITTSTPLIDMSQTWNASGVTFTGWRLNVTNTASAAGSLLIDLQIAGNSYFNVKKDGTAFIDSQGTGSGYLIFDSRGMGAVNSGVGFKHNGGTFTLATANDGASTARSWAIAADASFVWSDTNGSALKTTDFDVRLYRDAAAGVLALANSTHAMGFRVYNTTDQTSSAGVAPTNYERGLFDWTTTANQLTIGALAGGTGIQRQVDMVGASFLFTTVAQGNMFIMKSSGLIGQNGQLFGFSSGSDATTGADSSIGRTAPHVIAFNDATTTNPVGWYQWAGQTRVTSDVTFTSTTTLATVTGLSLNVQAGRTYSFTAEISWTDAAAGGLQLAIAGTATATNIIYDGWIIDSGSNGIKGNTQATALGTAVATSTTTGTAGHATITGTITVNAAGTLLVQAAQNTSNGTATTIKRGSTFIVQDMP